MYTTKRMSRIGKLFPVLSVTAAVLCLAAGVAQADVYSQNFNGFADGTTGTALGDGSEIGSTLNDAGVITAQVLGDRLLLTDTATGSTRASFRIPALASSSSGWTATFDFTITDAVGGNPPADGFSFNYGAIPARTGAGAGVTQDGGAEGGWNGGIQHISFEVDSWRNGDIEQGVNIGVNNSGHPGPAFTNGQILPDDGTVDGTATISWDPFLGASFSTTGLDTNANFINVPTPGFTGDDSYVFAFSARTGGATEDLFFDNIVITTIPEPTSMVLVLLGLLGLVGCARRRRRR